MVMKGGELGEGGGGGSLCTITTLCAHCEFSIYRSTEIFFYLFTLLLIGHRACRSSTF